MSPAAAHRLRLVSSACASMVFPMGARIWELAADHLDRLPGKSLIDGLFHKSGVAENDHA